MPTDDGRSLHKIKIEIEEELVIAGPCDADEWPGFSPTESLFDPTEIERERIGLRNLLGAVEALDRDFEPGDSSHVDRSRGADAGSTLAMTPKDTSRARAFARFRRCRPAGEDGDQA